VPLVGRQGAREVVCLVDSSTDARQGSEPTGTEEGRGWGRMDAITTATKDAERTIIDKNRKKNQDREIMEIVTTREQVVRYMKTIDNDAGYGDQCQKRRSKY
jgi:hypothetical protein